MICVILIVNKNDQAFSPRTMQKTMFRYSWHFRGLGMHWIRGLYVSFIDAHFGWVNVEICNIIHTMTQLTMCDFEWFRRKYMFSQCLYWMWYYDELLNFITSSAMNFFGLFWHLQSSNQWCFLKEVKIGV